MSNRTLVELNHDYCPQKDFAIQKWAEQMRMYMCSGDKSFLPQGVTFKHIRHHSEPDPLAHGAFAELEKSGAVVCSTARHEELRAALLAGAADVEKLAREIAPIIDWLEDHSLEVMKQAMARRDGAGMRNATAKEIKAGKRLAEKMMGHKLTHVSGTVEEHVRYCDMQERIADKLEAEAKQFSQWADVLRRSLQPPAAAPQQGQGCRFPQKWSQDAFVILAALDVAVDWELAPSIMEEIHILVKEALALPAPPIPAPQKEKQT